jgi:hypothetical protein
MTYRIGSKEDRKKKAMKRNIVAQKEKTEEVKGRVRKEGRDQGRRNKKGC